MRRRGLLTAAAVAGGAVVGLAFWQAHVDGMASPTYLTLDVSVAPQLVAQARAARTLFFIFTKKADKPAAASAATGGLAAGGDTAVNPKIWLAYRERLKEPLTTTPRRFHFRRENLQLFNGDWQSMPRHFHVNVRLDGDSLAGPDQPGDIVGSMPEQALGAMVDVVLDTLVMAPPPPATTAAEAWDDLQVWNPRQVSRDQLFGKPKLPAIPAMPKLNHEQLRAFLLNNTGV